MFVMSNSSELLSQRPQNTKKSINSQYIEFVIFLVIDGILFLSTNCRNEFQPTDVSVKLEMDIKNMNF
mgnify:CR=1 FL=1